MSLALPVLGTAAKRGETIGLCERAERPWEAPAAIHARGEMIDSHGRVIRDLRLSITDRCNFRCVYCMEPDVRFMGSAELLSVDDMERVVGVCLSMGVETIRLTGGEPTVHPDLEDIIRRIARLGAPDLAMTTNGSLMTADSARAWRAAGLKRVTISIDAVDPAQFARITRSKMGPGGLGGPGQVLAAIAAAKSAGFESVKLNAVVIRGMNDDQVVPLAGLAREFGVEMRFIEFMPLDSAHAWDRTKVFSADEIVERINAVYPLVSTGRDDPSSTSLSFNFADGRAGRVGVIAPVSRPFCGACSRLRITADGKVCPCLFSTTEWDLRPLLRTRESDDAIKRFLVDSTWTKQAGHGISSDHFVQPDRPMSAIGG